VAHMGKKHQAPAVSIGFWGKVQGLIKAFTADMLGRGIFGSSRLHVQNH